MNILGIHDGHNAAAALMIDGRIVAAVQEERLTRRKNEVGFPKRAIEEVLSLGGVRREDLDVIAVAGRGMPARVRGQDLVDAYAQRGTPMGRLKVRARESALFPLYRSLKRGGSRNERKQEIRENALDGVRAQFYDHHLWRAWRRSSDRGTHMLTKALLMALVGFLVASVSSSSIMALKPHWLLFAFALAFLNWWRRSQARVAP